MSTIPDDKPPIKEPVPENIPDHVSADEHGRGLLLPHHQRLLDDSSIAPEVALARGYRSVETKAELRRLGFSDSQCRVPALLIPIPNIHGEVVLYQARPDEPRICKGKALKYETPRGARMTLDVPPPVRSQLGDPSVPLFVTEGARKADSAVSRGFCCISLLGVWNYRGTNEHGGKTALSDWEWVALKGSTGPRRVYVIFDSDVMQKPEVYLALLRLKGLLESRGAEVMVVYLSAALDGKKVGLDDFFAQGGTVDDLLSRATSELRKPPGGESAGHPYRATKAGLVYEKPTEGGSIPVPLTNFTALIRRDITLDDGVEVHRQFEIVTRLNDHETVLTLPASKFSTMSWAVEHLGAQAIVFPGQGVRDHARCAIQHLSTDVEGCTVYGHTGWRQVGGQDVFLHSGGAIGEAGLREDLSVQLQPSLAGFRLPPPPEGAELLNAVATSLASLDVAPDRVTIPLLAAVYRAAIGDVDLSVVLCGPTGEGKTELAARAQQHFGPEMDARHLPANWSSTANSLEALAFEAKDALLVVDDFAPAGTSFDVQRLHAAADRLMRAQGNRSGRQRMRADGALRQPRPPRGLILSTGEDVPRGHSLRARSLIIEIEPGDVDWARMTECQEAGARGAYASAMSGFLRWMAARREEVLGTTWTTSEGYRTAGFGGTCAHRRSTSNLASLAAAFEVFLQFAVDAGAVDDLGVDTLRGRMLKSFGLLADEQDQLQLSQEPTRQFFDLLAAAIANGRAHVAGADGGAPEDPNAWGWKKILLHDSVWEARGERVGWLDAHVDGQDGVQLFLEPEASFAVVQRIGTDTGELLSVSRRTLQRRLREKGLLVQSEGAASRSGENSRRNAAVSCTRALSFSSLPTLRSGPTGPGQM